MKRWLLVMVASLFVVGLILSGCAQKPTAELEKAEKALQAAKEAGAPEWAPDRYQAAENKLNEGKNLFDRGKYKKAKPALEEAAQLAELARQEAIAAKKAAEAKEEKEEKPAPVVEEKPAIKTSHTVVKGECLWKIAGYEDVYGDPFQWPLIYDANRDQIKNPDLIYPGQVLTIPRDVALEKVKEARKRAGAPKPYLPPEK